ncbi:hypothetical protein BJ508DRAFT_419018 [Ascobolus immersus RN42]|uniref:Uncharacterized protein n=1 Tax=Ascobolus immersus RN42 TaxID=1160509 RepID=A0A3N4HHR2_ASCIM|nr:hypothetical protein BJ508DRAFT_419018 [Ascobolus immersus RN42]
MGGTGLIFEPPRDELFTRLCSIAQSCAFQRARSEFQSRLHELQSTSQINFETLSKLVDDCKQAFPLYFDSLVCEAKEICAETVGTALEAEAAAVLKSVEQSLRPPEAPASTEHAERDTLDHAFLDIDEANRSKDAPPVSTRSKKRSGRESAASGHGKRVKFEPDSTPDGEASSGGASESKAFACPFSGHTCELESEHQQSCGTFEQMSKLRSHVRNAFRAHVCNNCNERFGSSTAKNTHTDSCNKVPIAKSELLRSLSQKEAKNLRDCSELSKKKAPVEILQLAVDRYCKRNATGPCQRCDEFVDADEANEDWNGNLAISCFQFPPASPGQDLSMGGSVNYLPGPSSEYHPANGYRGDPSASFAAPNFPSTNGLPDSNPDILMGDSYMLIDDNGSTDNSGDAHQNNWSDHLSEQWDDLMGFHSDPQNPVHGAVDGPHAQSAAHGYPGPPFNNHDTAVRVTLVNDLSGNSAFRDKQKTDSFRSIGAQFKFTKLLDAVELKAIANSGFVFTTAEIQLQSPLNTESKYHFVDSIGGIHVHTDDVRNSRRNSSDGLDAAVGAGNGYGVLSDLQAESEEDKVRTFEEREDASPITDDIENLFRAINLNGDSHPTMEESFSGPDESYSGNDNASTEDDTMPLEAQCIQNSEGTYLHQTLAVRLYSRFVRRSAEPEAPASISTQTEKSDSECTRPQSERSLSFGRAFQASPEKKLMDQSERRRRINSTASSVRRLKCPYCEKTFQLGSRDRMERHMENIHARNGDNKKWFNRLRNAKRE